MRGVQRTTDSPVEEWSAAWGSHFWTS